LIRPPVSVAGASACTVLQHSSGKGAFSGATAFSGVRMIVMIHFYVFVLIESLKNNQNELKLLSQY
jgi:hypothetical protein